MARNSGPANTGADPQGALAGLSAFAVQDLAALRAQLDGINASAGHVSASLTKAFSSASVSGRAFNATLTAIAASLSQMLGSVGAGFLSQGIRRSSEACLAEAASACPRRPSPTAA